MTVIDGQNVKVEGEEAEDAPEDLFDVSGVIGNHPELEMIEGNGVVTIPLGLVFDDVYAVSMAVTGTFTIQVDWEDANGIPQEPVTFTVTLTTETSKWDPMELTLKVTMNQGASPTAATGELTWVGPDGTFEALQALDGQLAAAGATPGKLLFSKRTGNIDWNNASHLIKQGDTIADGEKVTVYFLPPSGKTAVNSPYTNEKSLTASGVSAALHLILEVVALTADTTVTVYKDGQAWNSPANGKSIELDDGSKTYAGTWTNNVWKATGTLDTGNYDVKVDNVKVGSISVTYGTSANLDVNYYTVNVATNPAAGGSAWIGEASAADKTKTSIVVLSGADVTISAAAKPGYKFTGWTASGTVSGSRSGTTEDIENVDSGARTYTANFDKIGINWDKTPSAQTITYGSTLTTMNWHAVYNTATNSATDYPIAYTVVNDGGLGAYVDFTCTNSTAASPTGGGITATNKSGVLIPAGTYEVQVQATDGNGSGGNSTPINKVTIVVNKQKLARPEISGPHNPTDPNPTKGADPTMLGASDGWFTFDGPTYPTDAGVTLVLFKGSSATSTTVPAAGNTITGQSSGTYYVQATLSEAGAKNYEWNNPVSGDATKSNSGNVELKDPGVNNPSISQEQTYEKNTAITGRQANIVFNFNVGDWSTLDKLTIDGVDIDFTKCTVTQPSGGGKTGSISIPATYLDTLNLTNAPTTDRKTVEGTFGRTGITPLTNTASGKLLAVQTTYTVSFNLNGGTAASGGAPAHANRVISVASGTSAVPTFTWGSISNNAPTRSGYAFAGWSTDNDHTTAEWTSSSTSYYPAGVNSGTPALNLMDSTKWNTTVYAVWTPNVVKVTTKLNGTEVSGRKITLYNGTTATTFTGTTDSSGVVTFSGVPTGVTYNIYDELTSGSPTSTGVTVSATAGGTANAVVRYYDVNFVAVTSAADHGVYTAAPTSGNVIINSSLATRRQVTLPGTTPDTNYQHNSWTLTPASGVGSAPAASANSWTATQSASYDAKGAITLKPVFGRSGYALTVIVKLDDAAKNGATVKLSGGPSGYAGASGTTDSTGTVVFNGLQNGTYSITVNDGTEDWRDKGSVRINSADESVTLEYYTVTAALGTGAATASVSNPTTTSKIVIKGGTATVASTASPGYNGPVSWPLTKTGTANASTSTISGGTITVNDTVTATANYTPNVVTLTTKLNGSAKGGYVLTLYNGTTATTFTGTTSTTAGSTLGTVTFNAVPAGTYNIYDATGDTGVDVVVSAGSAGNGGSAEIRYYDVNFDAVTSAADHGVYTATPTSGNIIINSSLDARRKVDPLPGTTPDTNYSHSSWSVTSNGSGTANSVGNAPGVSATTWTPPQNVSYTKSGAITLKPAFTKSSTSIKVTVNKNGKKTTDTITITLTNQTDKTGVTTGEATFTGITTTGGLSSAKDTYVAAAKEWDNTVNTGNTVKVTGYTTDPYNITLNYYEYEFKENIPSTAASGATASSMPANSTKPVLSGTKIDYQAPTLTGYTFKGWATSATASDGSWKSGQATIDGTNNDSTTGKRIYYAIWEANPVSLTNMTAKGARTLNGIIEVSGGIVGGGGGTDLSNYDFTVTAKGLSNDNNAHGITVTPVTSGALTTSCFTVTGTPDVVGDIVFEIKATSKLNGQSKTATLTVTVEEVYTVEYKAPGATLDPAHNTLPTDDNKYTLSGKTYGSTATLSKITADTSGEPQWQANARNLKGWSLTNGGTEAADFNVSTASAGADTNKVISLYAVWGDGTLELGPRSMRTYYNMTKAQWDAEAAVAGTTCTASTLDLNAMVSGGTGAGNYTFSFMDGTTNTLPSFMTYNATTHTISMGTGRVGDVGTYQIKITLTDAGLPAGQQTATRVVNLVVDKTTPLIWKSADTEGLNVIGGPTFYTSDLVWDHTGYYQVVDPYETTKVLSYGTNKDTSDAGRWVNKVSTTSAWPNNHNQRIETGAKTYNYRYTHTGTDAGNYNPAYADIDLTGTVRTISLQVIDDNRTNPAAAWEKDYTNSQSPTYNPTPDWKTVKVSIRLPETGNTADIQKLTWVETTNTDKTSSDPAIKDVKIVKADGSTTRTAPDTLAKGDTGEYILTFQVNVHAAGTHTLKYTFTGESGIKPGSPSLTSTSATTAGDKLGSYKTYTATYTYTTASEASTLDKPHPDLTRVEVNDGITAPDGSQECGATPDHTYGTLKFEKQKAGGTEVIDEKQGGLHLVFAPISQDNGKSDSTNSELEYEVKLIDKTASNATVRTVTIPAGTLNADEHYHFYWEAATSTGNNSGPIPGHEFKVEVTAKSRDTALYNHSETGWDEVNAEGNGGGGGWKELTVDMMEIGTSFTDRVFNGKTQTGGGSFKLKSSYAAGIGTISINYDNGDGNSKTLNKQNVNLTQNTSPAPSNGTNPDHDYDIYLSVTRGTLYLALASTKWTGTNTNTVDAKVLDDNKQNINVNKGRTPSPHADWEIVQAPATLAFTKGSFTGQTQTPQDIRPTPYVTYTTGDGAQYNDSNKRITDYYDIVYSVVSAPSGSSYTTGQVLTETDLQNFMADVGGDYTFKAKAKYKTENFPNGMTEAQYTQFMADVSEASDNFKFSTQARTVASIILERFEAVNGTTGVTNVDTGVNLTEDRGVIYGNGVEATDDRRGFYDASDNGKAKQMHLEGLRITVKWTGGADDVYIVGTNTLPTGANWNSSATNVAAAPALNDLVLNFKGAGVNKNFSTNLSFTYGGKTSNTVTYTMEKRPIDYTVVSDDERVWDNTAKVKGEIQFTLPDNLTGDDVAIAVTGDYYQTSNVKYKNWDGTPYGPDAAYTTTSNAGKEWVVRAQKVGTAGNATHTDLTGDDKAFYKRGKETPGKASIKPSQVTMINVAVGQPTTETNNQANLISKNGANTGTREDEKKIATNRWSVGSSISWEIWNNSTKKWEPIANTSFFAIDHVYRVTVEVTADTNHYMSKDAIDRYTINNHKDGEQCITDLDDWKTREDNVATVTVDESTPFHPDWLPEDEVLYHNKATFTYLFHTYKTPSLQFGDQRGEMDLTSPDVARDTQSGVNHFPTPEPSNYVHHTETVKEGSGSLTYTITVNASVKDIYGAQVLLTNRELLDAGATLEVIQGNGDENEATPVSDRVAYDSTVQKNYSMMYKYGDVNFEGTKDLIIYKLTIPASVTAHEGIYHLELQAMGSTDLANWRAEKVDVAKSYYTFTLEVLKEQVTPPPVIAGETPLPVVTYWLGENGYTNDLTSEKMASVGSRPTFTPKVVGLNGYAFKGWSETDPAKLKEGQEPELVDPLKISITDDKIYYAYYVLVTTEHKYFVIGYPDGTFRPDAPITRAEVATIIARSCLDGFVEGSDYGNPGGYSDIGTKRWYTSAISYCSMAGVFNGYPDGTFRPNDYITRQELALVVGRLAGLRVNMGLPFDDADTVNKWARDGVYTCYILGYVDGYTDGTFRPKNNITRAETVKIFNGYLNRGVDAKGLEGLTPFVLNGDAGRAELDVGKQYLTWEDVTEKHWAYYEIIEASNRHDYHWPKNEAKPPEAWDASFVEAEWLTRAKYVITWEAGEGVLKDTTTRVAYDHVPEIPQMLFIPAGKELAGWAYEPDGEVLDMTTTTILGATTFYAVYRDLEDAPPTFTVTYEIGEHGDMIGLDREVVEEGMAPVAVPIVTAHEGYEFLGWAFMENGMTVDVTTLLVTYDVTLYAVYREESDEPVLYTHYAFMEGYEDGNFYPSDAITRATVADMIARSYGADYNPNRRYDVSSLSDIPANYWAANAIGYCVEKGIFNGYPDGTFLPEGTMTRQEFSVVIAKMAGVQANQGLPFTDADSINKWARDYVYTVYV
ncbi:MAG: S-layer homology domain-containing protein, partial [Oscillospiraceae bacterium]|nr:S-layer homology domain-containing protein [Oscillospiraceae bacterium]